MKRPCGKNLVKAPANLPEETQDSAPVQEEMTAPLVDIIENDNEFMIIADMPGADSETIDVKYNDGELTIFADTIDQLGDEEDVDFSCLQFDPGSYFRNFRIGESINSDAITADYNDGVLTVHLPKREEIQPRKIAVKKK
ncbi:MAG: Hsp20/alpha crystallin family protein [Planctomycetia bacterium]|nr:Hsp20/alpha crystallin family protein [Planctomycetia bacterium]